MKRMESGKKLLSILLCLCMLLQNAPMTAFAAAGDNLCAHHSSHNDSCGYSPADSGSPCTHAHSENCYVDTDGTMVKDCHHAHGDCGFTPDIPEKPCGHSHDGSCGYAEPKQPIPCGHSCEINGCTLNEDGTYTCLHTACDKSCGYFAGDPGTPCGHTECDNTCGYAPKVPGTPCTHECSVKSGCYKLLCSHADGGHDKDCGYVASRAEARCMYDCHICQVQNLVNALPEVTESNLESVKTQMDAIDAAKAKLTDEERDQVGFSKYTATISAINAISGQPGAERPMTVMQIYVKMDGVHESLEVEPSDRIGDIKLKIQDMTGYTPAEQILTYRNQTLADDKTLQDYSIVKDATISLSVVPITYTVSIAATANGKVESNVSKAAAGDNISLTITPDEGYEIVSLTINNGTVPIVKGEAGKYTFLMPASDVTVTTVFCNHSGNESLPTDNGDNHIFICSVCGIPFGAEHTYTNGVCICGAKQTYSVSMHSKAAGVKIVGNPVATHGEQLTVTLENTASRKIAGVWLREVYLGSEWLNLNQNGITFDAATNTVTIPGELVRDNIQINAYAYLSITLDPAGGVYNTNGMIFDTHFSENEDGIWVSDDDYFMAGYTYSFSRLFVKEGSNYLHLEDAAGTKYTQEHIDLSSDLDFTYIWECLHRTTKVVDSGDGTHKVVCANDGHPIETDIAHTPIYTLNEAGDTITLSCKEDCGYTGTARVDISGKTYDGKSIGHTPVETDGALANTVIYPTYYQNGEEYNGTPTNVGTYTAVCTLGDVTASREFTIAKAPLTVTAVDNTITYGDLPAANGVEFSGFVNSENHTYLGGTVTYSYDYSQYGDAGTYRIVPSGLSYENYQITYVPGKLTVNPRKVELTWNNVQDRSYGDGKTVTAAIGNLLNGDQVSVTVTGGDAAVIGTHTAKAENLSGEKAKNYTLTGVENSIQEYLINKALLNSLVNAPADRTLETYCSDVDDVIQELPASVTYTAQNGDVTARIQWSCDSYDPTPGAANTFVWEVSAGQLENHDAGNVMTSGTVTVTNAAALTVTHTGKNVQITYTGETYDVSEMFEVDANAGNESYTVMGITGEGTLNGTDLTVTKAGTFTVKLTTAAQGAYGTGEAVATLTVTKANISDHVRIYFQSRYYDGTPVQLEVIRKNTMQASNLVEGVDYSITCVGDHLVNGMPFRAGEYKVILTGMGNYTGTVTDIYLGMVEGIIPVYEETLVIDPAPINVYDEDIDVADKTYDGTKTAAVSCFIASGAIVVGDDVKVEVKGEFSDAKVGKDKLVNLTYTLSGADRGNYVIYGPKTTTADIIPAKLNVTAKSGSKVYGETDPALTYDVTGLVGDEELTGSLTRESGENAGTYAITVGTLAAGSNYTMDFTGATFTVQMRNVSAEAEDQTIVYGEAISQEKYTVTGLLAGHTATATLVPSTDKVTASGEMILEDVKITAEGIDVTDNYDIAIAAPAKLVINPDTTKIQKLTDKNVTSSDRDEIQAVLDQLADADIEGADDGTAEKWGALKENCEALLEKIDAVEKDVAECKKAAAAIDADTVTSADQEVLEDLSEKMDKLLISDNLTDAERKELEKVQKTVADMLDTLARTEADSKAAMDTIEGLNNKNVTSADKGDLEKAIDTIDKLLSATHLTEAERKQLIEAKAEAQKLLGVIETVQQSTETENTAKVENVNSGNVKPTDKKALVDAKSDLEKVLKDYGSNLTAEEKAEIETEIDRIESALASLEKAEAVTAAIEALPMDVEPDDEKTGEKILAAKAGYDALTVHEKSLVPEDSVKKLEKLIYALTDYEITDVKNGKWSKGSDKGITFIVNGPLDKFVGIEIDGAHVYRFLYTADAGSTIITLRTILLGTLSNGDHTITVIYEDGEVSGTFRILPRATSAATGDSSDVYIWTCTLAVSATVLAILVMNRKRSAKR